MSSITPDVLMIQAAGVCVCGRACVCVLLLGKCAAVHFRSISGGRKGADKEQKGLVVLFFQEGAAEIEQSEDERSCGLAGGALAALSGNLARDMKSNTLSARRKLNASTSPRGGRSC